MATDLIVKVILQLQDELTNLLGGAEKKLETFGEKAKNISRDLGEFGRTIGAAGAAMSAGMGYAVKEFANLESATAVLKSTMTGKDGLSANFAQVEALAIRLGNQLPGNTADFTAMINKLLQLGVTQEAVLGGVGEAAAKLGAVLKIPYEQAATIAAKLKEATGTSQEDMLKFMDTIQRIGHQGVEAGEMMYAFARSGGALKQFGLQGEEAAKKVGTLFAQLIKAGASGETVGTGFAAILNRLQQFESGATKPMRDVQEKLAGLGIQLDFFDNKTQEFKGIENMIAQFEKLKQLKTLDQGSILQGIFGGGQDQQFAALLTRGGVGANKAMAEAMASQADLQTRAQIQLETLSAKWEAAFGTFQNTMAKFGETVAPALGRIVDWMGATSESIGKWIDENKGLATTIGTVFGSLAVALTAIGGAALTASAIASVLGAIGTGFSTIAGVVGTVGPFFVALATNPIALAIFGAAAVGVAVYKNWDTITGAMTKAVEAVKSVMKALIDKVQEGIKWFQDLGKRMMQIGEDIVNGIIQGIAKRAQAVYDAVTGIGDSIVGTVKKVLQIKSPSVVMEDLGRQTVAGFVLGLGLGLPAVSGAADQLAQAVPNAAQQAIEAQASRGINAEGISPDQRAQMLEDARSFYAESDSMHEQWEQGLFTRHAYFQSAKFATTQRYNALNLDSSSAFFGQMAALMNTKSRAMFEVGKGAAIAQTIIDTYASAQKAYLAMAGIPYIGPALGVAAAAAAVAAGVARVQAIRSTSFGSTTAGGALAGGGVSGSVIPAGQATVAVPPPPNRFDQQAVQGARVINVDLRGTEVYSAAAIRESLIPALNEALGDGVTLNVRAA